MHGRDQPMATYIRLNFIKFYLKYHSFTMQSAILLYVEDQ